MRKGPGAETAVPGAITAPVTEFRLGKTDSSCSLDRKRRIVIQGVAITIVAFLRQHGRSLAIAVVTVPVLVGLVFVMWPSGRSEQAFYTPGVTLSREDCVYEKMKSFGKVDRPTLKAIALECELTVQSIEGHEGMRKAWEARQASRPAEPKPAPAVAEPAVPEGDRLRRVWR